MLILKEPIKLKSLSPIVSPPDGFFERMDANYKQMQAKYGPEELFYLLNQPPEIYVEEGGMTTLLTLNQNQMNQEMRLEMIYNLFNRLMMSDSSDFTYQDTVFVQNMLEKLGVRNVSEFMRQLYEMQEDTKNIKQLLNIYKNNMEALSMIVESVKMQEGKDQREVSKEENNTFPYYWIHNEILKRLQTGNVYDTAAAFQKNEVHHQRSIDSREIDMAGQIHMSESLMLQNLENSVLIGELPFLDHRVNIYEEGTGEDNYKKDEIINELAQAVLLNISENLYQTELVRQNDGKKAWYQFKGDFHQILEDTLNRFSTYHFHDIHYIRYKEGKLYQQNVNALRGEKIRKLNKILEISVKNNSENKVSYSEENLENQKAAGRSDKEESPGTEQRKDERIQRVTETEEFQILNEINVANKRLEHRAESLEKEKEQEKRLVEEIRILNEENRRRLEETEEKEELLKKVFPVQINKERTRKETLLLLEHPELLDQYAEETGSEAEETSERLTLFQSSLKEIEKRMESESAEQIQNLVKAEAKLRQEYVTLFQKTGQSIRLHPAKEGSVPAASEKIKEQEGIEEIRTLIKENQVSPEMKRTVLTYLDTVSKERREKEFYQSRKHIAEELKTESVHKELMHIRQEDVQDTVEQIKKQGQSHVFWQMQRQTVFTNQSMQLYHKEPDTFTREMLEDIVSPATITNRTEEVNDQAHAQKIVTKQQIHKQVDNLVQNNSERISEMISRGVQRQLNTISEQVYHKLEKKLSIDRKRRGY